ncbi:response regulator [Alphaproteobacteria bacterium HT1-32]|nr:response regulator [Alphaproteobacteria bacterium HT1-32]
MEQAVQISYQPALVATSFLIAFFASYAALDIGNRLFEKIAGKQDLPWIIAGAVVLGGGIWSMHFIAILAADFGLPVRYGFRLTLLSLVVAVLFSAIGLWVATSTRRTGISIPLAGLASGIAIASMHYIGMAALVIPARAEHDMLLILLSVLIAVVAATAAFWMMSNVTRARLKVLAGVIMAIAICGMHYTGMAAMSYFPENTIHPNLVDTAGNEMLAGLVVFGSALVIFGASAALYADRRISAATDREQAARSQSEERFRNLVEALPVAVVSTRLSDGTIVYANARAANKFRYDPALENASNSDRYVNPEERMQLLESLRQTGEAEVTESLMRRYDGTEFWARISSRRVDDPDGALVISGFFDISDRIEIQTRLEESQAELRRTNSKLQAALEAVNKYASNLESALREAREANQATRAKSTFLASMSHEIRTPMNGVIGLLEILSDTTLDNDQIHLINTIRDSAHSLLKIVDDVLDLSKIEAGKIDIEHSSFDPEELVESVAETLAVAARKKQLDFLLYFDPEIPRHLNGDPVRLRQVLTNLIGNAVKFTSTGSISVSATLEGTADSIAAVRFTVADTGIGISPEQTEKLFEPFSQAEASTTRRFGGTGLGLTISRQLTNLMGGEISVESEPDAGSQFHVNIPFSLSAVISDDARQSDDISGLRVCIVTGDEKRRHVLSSYARYAGAHISFADHPDHAQTGINGDPVDVVVLGSDIIRKTPADDLESFLSGLSANLVAIAPRQSDAEAVSRFGEHVFVLRNLVRRRNYLHAIAVAAGRSSPKEALLLPANLVDESEQPVREQPSIDFPEDGPKVLVAEDHPTNREVLRRQLNRLGIQADIATHGEEAFSFYQVNDYQLLLTDCHMPGMDGYELTRKIREVEKESGAHLPVIAITANALSGEQQRCIAAGMDDYLSKPVEISVLDAKLRTWIDLPSPAASAVMRPAVSVPAPMTGTNPEAEAEAAISIDILQDLVGDDRDSLRTLLQSFVDSIDSSSDEITAASDAGDADAFEEATHKLLGAARTAGAPGLVSVLDLMRKTAMAGDWASLKNQQADLFRETSRVKAFVDAF